MSNVIKTICHRTKDLSITLEVVHTDSAECEKQIMCWFNEGLNGSVDAVFLPYDKLKEVYNLSYVALVKYLKANSFRTPILKEISPTENTDSEVTAPVQSGVVASEGKALLSLKYADFRTISSALHIYYNHNLDFDGFEDYNEKETALANILRLRNLFRNLQGVSGVEYQDWLQACLDGSIDDDIPPCFYGAGV